MIKLQNSGIPVYLQIYNFIRDDIEAGRLVEGNRLDSERTLAKKLNINRATVGHAYKKLEDDGFLLARRGSGYVVTHQHLQTALNVDIGSHGVRFSSPLAYIKHNNGLEFDDGLWRRSVIKREVSSSYYFVGTMTPAELCPVELLNRTIRALIDEKGAALYDYCSSQGLQSLREEICKHLQKKRINVTPSQIIIGNEVMQLVDFLLNIYVNPGDLIITEEPIFIHVYQLFKLHGAEVKLIPMDDKGMRTDLLERELEKAKPKLLCVTPTCHNPTNATMSMDRRLHLATLAHRYGFPVIEWSHCGDLEPEDTDVIPLKAIDTNGFVIYINSFTMSFAQSIPISYAVANARVISAVAKMIQMTVFQMNTLSQHIMAACLSDGSYKRHLNTVRAAYEEKAKAMYRALSRCEHLGLTFREHPGGAVVWCRLPDYVNPAKLYVRAREENIYYHPGELFYPNSRHGKRYLRLSYLYPTVPEIEEGIARLVELIEEQCPRTDSDLS